MAFIYFNEDGNITDKLKEKAYRFDLRDGEVFFIDLTADVKESDFIGNVNARDFNLEREISEIFQDYGKKWRGHLTAQLREWIDSRSKKESEPVQKKKESESIKKKKEESTSAENEPLVFHANLVKETKNFSAYEIDADDAKGKIYLPKEFTKKRIKIRVK